MSLFGKVLAEHMAVVENGDQTYMVNKEEFDQVSDALIAVVKVILTEQVKQIGGGQWQDWNCPFIFKYRTPPHFLTVNLIELILQTTWPEYKFKVVSGGPNGTSRVKEKRLFLKPVEYAVYEITAIVSMKQLIEERSAYIRDAEDKKKEKEEAKRKANEQAANSAFEQLGTS